MHKRLLSLILAMLTVFSLAAAAYASDAPDTPEPAAAMPSEETVHERLMAMQEKWPDGSHWDGNSYYVDKNGQREYGCFGFACMLQEAAFPGLYGPYRYGAPSSLAQVHVGDMLSYNGASGHTVIVIEVHEDYVVVAEGNMDNGVRWGRTMSAEQVSAIDYRWTYYYQDTRKNGWFVEDDGWYYYRSGGKLRSTWLDEGGCRYYLGASGKMYVGWGQVNGQWYYFNQEHDGTYGRLLTSVWFDDGTGVYYLGASGTMAVGWQVIDNRWYYFNKSHDGAYGRMLAGQWLEDGGAWYYLTADGTMAEGLYWVNEGGYEGLYCFNYDHDGTYGKMMSGWQTVNGYRYYLETRHNGKFGQAYVDGTYMIGGTWYTFDAQGRLLGE